MAKQNTSNKEPRNSLMPEIRKVIVGIKEAREVNQYPLSIPDQLELADQITEALSLLMDLESKGILQSAADENEDAEERKDSTIEIVKYLLSSLQRNLPFIVDKVFDDVSLNEITNNQLMEIGLNIYEMNYVDLAKNLKDLFKKTKTKNQDQNQIQ